MSQAIHLELEVPDDLARLRLPAGVQQRLTELLDKQDTGTTLNYWDSIGQLEDGIACFKYEIEDENRDGAGVHIRAKQIQALLLGEAKRRGLDSGEASVDLSNNIGEKRNETMSLHCRKDGKQHWNDKTVYDDGSFYMITKGVCNISNKNSPWSGWKSLRKRFWELSGASFIVTCYSRESTSPDRAPIESCK